VNFAWFLLFTGNCFKSHILFSVIVYIYDSTGASFFSSAHVTETHSFTFLCLFHYRAFQRQEPLFFPARHGAKFALRRDVDAAALIVFVYVRKHSAAILR
jgi:hypothetical protein